MKKVSLSKISLLTALLFTLTLVLPQVTQVDVYAATTTSNDVVSSSTTPSAVTVNSDEVPSSTTPSIVTTDSDEVTSDTVTSETISNDAVTLDTTASDEVTITNNVLPPSNLAYTLTTPDDIKLTWNSVYGATGYNVYVITDGQLRFAGKTTTTSYTSSNLSEGSYSYVVSTLSADGESGPCAPVSVDVVYPDMTAPSTLTNTIKNGNDIVLSWSSVKYAEKYNVYQISTDGQKTLVSSATGLTYTITNSPAGTYNYAVSAVNSLYGESPISDSLQVNVVFPIMTAPSNLTYKIQNVNDVVLTWGAVSYANNYKVYELIDGEEVLKTTVSSTTATLSNVQAGNHTYAVHSISTRFGESIVGSQISLTMNQVTMQAPTNLTYSLTNGTNITLKWGTVTYATAYKIYQIIDGQKVLKSTITGTTITYSNMPSGNYIYEVYSYSDRFGESPQGSQISITLGDVIMAAPTNFTYNINNGNDIALTWDSMENATSYKIYLISNGQKTLKSTVTGTSITYTNMPSGSYSYEIHSYSTSFGESAGGSQVSFTLTFPIMAPPANLVENIKSATDFTLSWDASSYATSYKVYQIVNGTKILKSTVSGTSVTYTNMSPGDYTFEVHSYSTRFGESPEGSNLTMTLEGQVMQAPADLTYSTANINDITLKWSAVTYATSYKIYQVIDGQNVLKKTVTGTSVTFTNMPEDEYHYVVTSVSTLLGESPIGAEITFYLDLPTMVAPGNLTYKIQNINSVVLTWSASTYANSYKVYELIDGQEIFKTTVTSLTATLSNVVSGEHTYVVHSVSTRFGESPEGSQISFNLEQQYMEAPTNFTYSIANMNDITLKWDAATYATSYKLYRVIDGQKSLVRTVSTTSVTFTNMPAGDYDYVVTSVSTLLGESLSGSEVNFSLDLPTMIPPANLAYKIQNGNSVVLTWEASTYANSYKVYELVDDQEILKTTVTSLTATLSNVAAGEHTYVVHSVSTRLGESPDGSRISFNLQQYYMEAPTSLTYSITNGNDITLKWNAVTYATSYKIYRTTNGQKSLVKTVTTTATTFTNMPAGDYDYIVTSVSTLFGESSDSEVTFSLDLPAMMSPVNLAYKIQNGNNVVLTWEASTYANSYKVYELIDGQEVFKSTVTSLTATLSNVEAGDHTYVVHSVSTRFGEASEGSQISFNLQQYYMEAPENLTYSTANINDIILKWTASTYATSYKIYRVIDGQKSLVKTVTTTSATFTNMPEGNYDYIVTSVSTLFGESPNESEVTFSLDLPTMIAPSNLTQTITNGNYITLKWNASTYATAYNIYQIIDGEKSLVKTVTSTSVTFANMPEGDYSYEVHSYSNRFGESEAGSIINFTLNWPVVQPPVLTDSIYNVNNFTLSWQAVTWANEYSVYEVTDGTRELLYKGTALSYKAFNLSEGTHSYEVTAYSTRFGESASSNKITETIIYPDMQSPVANLKIIDSTTAVISWNFITYANGYNVYEIIDGKPVLLTKNLNNLSYTVSNLSYKDHEYYVTSVSNSFGQSQPSNTVIAKLIVDTEPPKTISDAPINWVNQSPIVVKLSTTDNETGVANTYYSINDGSFTEGTSITVDKEGINKISYYSVDKVGNKENIQTSYVKIDKIAPSTTLNAPETWVKEDVTVNLAAADTQSGVSKTFYSVNDSDFIEGTAITINKEGLNKIQYYSVDKAGNKEIVKTSYVKIDGTTPVTTSNISRTWTKEDVTVNLAATDAQSGVYKTFYSIDGSDYLEGTSFIIKDEGIHKITFYSVDIAGNIESANTTEVKIDKTVPIIKMDILNEYKLGTALPLIYTAEDNLSGVVYEKMVVLKPNETIEQVIDNNSNIQLEKPGTYKVWVTVTDAAGNSATIEREFIVYIPGTIEVTPKIIKGNNGIFTVRVNVPSEYNNQGLNLDTVTLNGVKALANNNGYYNQAKLGQFKFERSDFNWIPSDIVVEFRGYINGYLVVGETTVKVQK